jgi:hypothetical protein
MEKTAVQWFYDKMENLKIKAKITGMSKTDFVNKKEEFLGKANEMFEQQIMGAHYEGSENYRRQYYNETFKQ